MGRTTVCIVGIVRMSYKRDGSCSESNDSVNCRHTSLRCSHDTFVLHELASHATIAINVSQGVVAVKSRLYKVKATNRRRYTIVAKDATSSLFSFAKSKLVLQ